jgi:predicted anti-sigma-YlaC factor YlaD
MKVISIGRFECREVRELADAFIDNELLVETNLQVLGHLGRCRDCRAFVEEKSRLKRLVYSSVKQLDVPEALRGSIWDKIRKGESQWRDYKGRTY